MLGKAFLQIKILYATKRTIQEEEFGLTMREMVRIKAIRKSSQGNHCEATNYKYDFLFFVSIVCNFNTLTEKKFLWKELTNQSNTFGDKPWVVTGDYNAIRNQNEKIRGLILQ